MRARAVTVTAQGNLEVAGLLAAELGPSVRRVGIAVAVYAVSTQEGVSQLVAGLDVAFLGGGMRGENNGKQDCRGAGYDLHVRNHLVF